MQLTIARSVEGMLKKQLAPTKSFPPCSSTILADTWSFIPGKGNRGSLNWGTPGTVESQVPH